MIKIHFTCISKDSSNTRKKIPSLSNVISRKIQRPIIFKPIKNNTRLKQSKNVSLITKHLGQSLSSSRTAVFLTTYLLEEGCEYSPLPDLTNLVSSLIKQTEKSNLINIISYLCDTISGETRISLFYYSQRAQNR